VPAGSAPGELAISARCHNKLCVCHLRARTRSAVIGSVSRAKSAPSSGQNHFARTTVEPFLILPSAKQTEIRFGRLAQQLASQTTSPALFTG
jgi:hypothetical protein